MKRITINRWKGTLPALLIGLALAFLQIVFGLATYNQSKSLLWEGKFQSAQNLTHGLINVVLDPLILRDYAGLESRILQTMSNREVASVLLADASGKVIAHLQRAPGAEPRLMFEPAQINPPDTKDEITQNQDETFITTWGRVKRWGGFGCKPTTNSTTKTWCVCARKHSCSRACPSSPAWRC